MHDQNLPGPKLNILSLEDSVRDFEIMKEKLADAGFNMNISMVDREDQFVDSLRNNRYDIILIDFKLAGFNAFESLKWCREICPDIPCICVSGTIGEETAIELIKKGAVDYVLKDRLSRLPFAIKRALNEAREKVLKRITSEKLLASEEERTRSEKILRIQYKIAREVVLARDIPQLVGTVKTALAPVLDTTNFFVALYDKEKDTLKQVIFRDEKDDFHEWKADNSLSGIVVKYANTLLLKRHEIEQIAKQHNLELLGTQAECWLGVPLSTGDKVIGAMVVQSYTDPDAYDIASASMLEIIANELSTFIVRKSAEAEILRMNEELEFHVAERTAQLQSAYQEMESFSYTVSHDLRAPVRGIHGFTRILLEDHAGALNEEGKRVCAVIQDNALRMGQLIDDLLAFSRLNRTEMQKQPIDMIKLVNTVYQEITDDAARDRIRLSVGDICNVTADPNLIKQVWTNLLSNAIKYTSKVKAPSISISCDVVGDKCVYCIRDNGIGFDMQYSDKLFGVFQRLHNVREFEGNGVGLASVKRIIHHHGGEVWAEGKVDEGAAFYFSLYKLAGS